MIQWFVTHRTAANLLMVGLLVLGALSLPGLRRETFPDYDSDEVEIRVRYPGATSQDVEEEILTRIEDAVDRVTHIREVRAEARENIALVTVEMLREGEFSTFIADIKTEVEAIDDFPPLAERPAVREKGKTSPVISVAVTGDMPATDLKTYSELLGRKLKELPEVSQVEVRGFSERRIRIEFDLDALREFNLTAGEAAAIVSAQTADLPGGEIQMPGEDLVLRFADKRRTASELADIVIVGSESGGEVRLADVANIFSTFEKDEEKILFGGRRAGLLAVEKTNRQDSLRIFESVRQFVERENAQAPPGVHLALTEDGTSIIKDRLSMLVKNGAQGVVLVFLVLGLVFTLRFAFWVAMALPVSFFGAFFLAPLFDMTINMFSMVGLLMAIGLLIDGAIVIADNVMVHRSRGEAPIDAAVKGTSEVFPGVFSSFLTTLAVFAPLTMLEGEIGLILRAVPLMLMLVLVISLVEAFLILPHHLQGAMRRPSARGPNRLRRVIASAIIRATDFMGDRVAPWTIRNRYTTIGMAILLFLASISLIAGGTLKFQAMPNIEGDTLHARILLPQGTPLERTEALAGKLTDALDVVDATFTHGRTGGRKLVEQTTVEFNVNPSANEEGAHVATIKVDLLSAGGRNGLTIDEIITEWRNEAGALPDTISVIFTEPSPGPTGNPIEIRLTGGELDGLKAAAEELHEELARYEGTFNLIDDLRPGKREIRLRLKAGATRLGLTSESIAGQIRSAYHGATVSNLMVGPDEIEIEVRLADGDRRSLGGFDRFPVFLPDGSHAPLDHVAEISEGRSWSRIARVDGRRAVTVIGEVDTRVANTNAILSDLEHNFLPALRERHPSITSISFEGERRRSEETGASMVRNFGLGLIGVFLLLSFQFRSFIEPLIVMSAIPFILVGVTWGHLLMGYPLTLPSVLGIFALAGVVVNNSILLVDFVKLRRGEGAGLHEAIGLATRQRFRPILLSTLTTLAGLLPLLFETSLQAQLLIPLAISLVFGLGASALLVLLILPPLYVILEDMGLTAPVEGSGPA